MKEEDVNSLAGRIPANFQMGVATSAWQIEGSSQLRGSSIWDEFADIPGKIKGGATADPACDHLNRLEEDLDLLTWLGVDAYRFSVSWPRIMPSGEGGVDQRGLDFYDRLIDGLLARDIAPVLTIYHWDLPTALEGKGGWNWEGISETFALYTEVLAKNFTDRISRWLTLNEPWCSAFLGYADTVMAPGKGDPAAGFEAAYRLLTAHGSALQVLRRYGAKEIGIALNLTTFIPEDPGANLAALHMDGIMNRLWLDPLAGRGIPQDLITATREITDWSFVNSTDLAAIAEPIDWLGINYYTPTRIASPAKGAERLSAFDPALRSFPGTPPVIFTPAGELTQMGWEVDPESLITTLLTTQQRMPGVPIYITENGAAFADELVAGEVDDQKRINYHLLHLEAAMRAKELGVELHGYFAWSFLDNLEWAQGWSKCFGLIRVDPLTQQRTPKASAYFYRDLLKKRVT